MVVLRMKFYNKCVKVSCCFYLYSCGLSFCHTISLINIGLISALIGLFFYFLYSNAILYGRACLSFIHTARHTISL